MPSNELVVGHHVTIKRKDSEYYDRDGDVVSIDQETKTAKIRLDDQDLQDGPEIQEKISNLGIRLYNGVFTNVENPERWFAEWRNQMGFFNQLIIDAGEKIKREDMLQEARRANTIVKAFGAYGIKLPKEATDVFSTILYASRFAPIVIKDPYMKSLFNYIALALEMISTAIGVK